MLRSLPAPLAQTLQREIKDSLVLQMTGAPVVVFTQNVYYRKIEAIKTVRRMTGLGLREAKDRPARRSKTKPRLAQIC